jgi:hypothetical protein
MIDRESTQWRVFGSQGILMQGGRITGFLRLGEGFAFLVDQCRGPLREGTQRETVNSGVRTLALGCSRFLSLNNGRAFRRHSVPVCRKTDPFSRALPTRIAGTLSSDSVRSCRGACAVAV